MSPACLGQVLGKGEETFVGDVLSPRNQVDLVVAACDRAVETHEERGVIHVEAGAVGVQRGGTGNHRGVHGKRQGAQSIQQARILVEKRRGRLGPQDDAGSDRLGWTIGSNGISIEFGHAGKERPAGTGAEFEELVKVLFVFGARPAIVLIDV